MNLAAILLLLLAQARPTETEVARAVSRGLEWLRTAPSHPAHGNIPDSDELILWTLVHANVPPADPAFAKYFRKVLDAPLARTYKVALQAMILEEVDRVKHQRRIAECAQFLVDNQCPNGQWSYGEPTDAVISMPSGPADVASAPVLKFDLEGRRVKPKIVRKIGVRRTRQGPAEGDNSNAQYAALGLRACFDAGVMVPQDTVLRAVKWWRESLMPEEGTAGGARGWNYTQNAHNPEQRKAYHAMTAGGVGSLVIYDHMLGRDWKKDPFVKAGLAWLTRHYLVNHDYYFMYALERACVLQGLESLGGRDWYGEGARLILDAQSADGSWGQDTEWNKATWNTCFAILFLKRATRPLVATEPAKKN